MLSRQLGYRNRWQLQRLSYMGHWKLPRHSNNTFFVITYFVEQWCYFGVMNNQRVFKWLINIIDSYYEVLYRLGCWSSLVVNLCIESYWMHDNLTAVGYYYNCDTWASDITNLDDEELSEVHFAINCLTVFAWEKTIMWNSELLFNWIICLLIQWFRYC